MKRVRARKRNRKPGTENRAPLAEDIVPVRSNGQRNWSSLNDEELIEYAKKFIEKKGLMKRNELRKQDYGLYHVLMTRKLIDKVGFENTQGNWHSMTDEELIEYARCYVDIKEIKSRKGLENEHKRLYAALLRRKLMDRLVFECDKRVWSRYSDDELVKYAQGFIKNKGIVSRGGLRKDDGGLYSTLRKKGLLYRLSFEGGNRNWASMTDEELVEFARGFVDKKEIKSRKELKGEDGSLYVTLLKRRLLDRLNFEIKRKEKRYWYSLTDKELVQHAQWFVDKKRIKNWHGLDMEDSGLFQTLRKRKLLERVKFEGGSRKWASMNDAVLIEVVQNFIVEKEIGNRAGLAKADPSMYQTLRRRNILDRVFSSFEQSEILQGLQQAAEAMRAFGESR